MKAAYSNINIRMEQPLKEDAENLFHELGLTMTTAIHMFVRQAVRSREIPFKITAAQPDIFRDDKPLRGEAYMRKLRESIRQLERGEVVVKTMDELRAYEK
ncbi:MAG: type II toxin-antitoxin system RelB/DinJ family antitoxin [Kiritimatiellaeota bacterium]|nr:type II toxin-antitoxin system RelB/DinJ family antitoxin [Kiritimatiellota bacterium]